MSLKDDNLMSLKDDNLMSLKGDNLKNLFLSYLNINSLRYKIVDFRQILEQTGRAVSAIP